MTKQAWLVAFITTLIFILVKGYTFNCGDQEEHLPQIYQMINPALYPHDYFITAYHQTFTVRFFFVWLIYLFHFVMPVAASVFMFHVLCVTVVAWCIQQIALHFNATPLFAQATSFFTLIFFNNYTIGGNMLMDIQLACGSFSAALCALAFYFMLNKRWYAVALFAGLAALFQVLIGLQVMVIMGMIYLMTEPWRAHIAATVKFGLLFLLAASPMLLPIVYLQMQTPALNQNALFYDILYRVRNPNHYLPSAFPMQDYIRFCTLTVIAGILHFFVNDKLKQLWRILFATILGGMFIYTFLLEGIQFMPIGKLQWFKTSTWMMMMDVVIIFAAADALFSNVFLKLSQYKFPSALLIAGSVLILTVLFNSRYIPLKRFQYRYHLGNYPPTDLAIMHEWIRVNTPVDCVVLTSPNNYWFLCEAQRSMPVGWKAIIHEPFFLIPWYAKFITAYHNGLPFKGFNVLEQATDYYQQHPPLPSDKLSWDYRLTDFKEGKINSEKETIVHQQGNYALLKVLSK